MDSFTFDHAAAARRDRALRALIRFISACSD